MHLMKPAAAMSPTTPLQIHPLTPDRWPDLEAVFAARGCGVARDCWCMCYRRTSAGQGKARWPSAATNKADFRAVVDQAAATGQPAPGLLAYRENAAHPGGLEPVGWLAVGPRAEYLRLARSPVMKPVDDQPVWSVICFVVPAAQRGQGIARALLAEAARRAAALGVTLEAYPVDLAARGSERVADDDLWFGPQQLFVQSGFSEVARRRADRPVMRLVPVDPAD
ncbi:MAG: hypothetical protein RL722_2081 [Pseudomonadota bacterium]|jgi:GNAT superfamily N-acetyltransferase